MTRRQFAGAGAVSLLGAPAAAGRRLDGLRIGVMDTTLRMAGKVEALAAASKLGFAGIQVSIGRQAEGGKLPLADPELQARYLAESKKRNVALAGTYLDILHLNCLKNDNLARQWIREGIDITRRLDARVLMIVFFGKCALETQREIDAATEALKELAPVAAKAGVVLGFENTLSAEANIRVLDRVGSRALQVYYDVGNATNMGGFDAPAEIRRLGKDRICQFHFKDKDYIGEGKVDFPAVLRAIADIDFRGFAVLETRAPSGSVMDDLRRNLDRTRAFAKGVAAN